MYNIYNQIQIKRWEKEKKKIIMVNFNSFSR